MITIDNDNELVLVLACFHLHSGAYAVSSLTCEQIPIFNQRLWNSQQRTREMDQLLPNEQ